MPNAVFTQNAIKQTVPTGICFIYIYKCFTLKRSLILCIKKIVATYRKQIGLTSVVKGWWDLLKGRGRDVLGKRIRVCVYSDAQDVMAPRLGTANSTVRVV